MKRARSLAIIFSLASTVTWQPQIRSKGPRKEFSLNLNGTSHRLEVQAFLILERVFGSKEFRVSVLLHADGQFIGKTSVGTVVEGKEILLSLRWDQSRQRFVASSQAAGSVSVLSFIPFALPDASSDVVPLGFSTTKNLMPNSAVSNNTEAPENQD